MSHCKKYIIYVESDWALLPGSSGTNFQNRTQNLPYTWNVSSSWYSYIDALSTTSKKKRFLTFYDDYVNDIAIIDEYKSIDDGKTWNKTNINTSYTGSIQGLYSCVDKDGDTKIILQTLSWPTYSVSYYDDGWSSPSSLAYSLETPIISLNAKNSVWHFGTSKKGTSNRYFVFIKDKAITYTEIEVPGLCYYAHYNSVNDLFYLIFAHKIYTFDGTNLSLIATCPNTRTPEEITSIDRYMFWSNTYDGCYLYDIESDLWTSLGTTYNNCLYKLTPNYLFRIQYAFGIPELYISYTETSNLPTLSWTNEWLPYGNELRDYTEGSGTTINFDEFPLKISRKSSPDYEPNMLEFSAIRVTGRTGASDITTGPADIMFIRYSPKSIGSALIGPHTEGAFKTNNKYGGS